VRRFSEIEKIRIYLYTLKPPYAKPATWMSLFYPVAVAFVDARFGVEWVFKCMPKGFTWGTVRLLKYFI
jgi:hypothetical protein